MSTRILRTICASSFIVQSAPPSHTRILFKRALNISPSRRLLSCSATSKMPESLTQSEIDSQVDPTVAKQYDTETSKVQQIKEFFDLVDGNKVGILNTYRKGVGTFTFILVLACGRIRNATWLHRVVREANINGSGPVGRSMAISKRVGPDFLLLANAHSRKFSDLNENKEVQLTFQDSKTMDWVSVSGVATTVSNTDPRIKDIWSKAIQVWFGDLGDGKHDGSPDDPRMALIEIKAKYVSYWLHQVGTLGFVKEIGVAAMTGKVAVTGALRELTEDDLEQARKLE